MHNDLYGGGPSFDGRGGLAYGISGFKSREIQEFNGLAAIAINSKFSKYFAQN